MRRAEQAGRCIHCLCSSLPLPRHSSGELRRRGTAAVVAAVHLAVYNAGDDTHGVLYGAAGHVGPQPDTEGVRVVEFDDAIGSAGVEPATGAWDSCPPGPTTGVPKVDRACSGVQRGHEAGCEQPKHFGEALLQGVRCLAGRPSCAAPGQPAGLRRMWLQGRWK